MRNIILGIALGATTLFGTVAANAVSFEQVLRGSFPLYEKNSYSCSSQFVHSGPDGDYLLTAAHCVSDPKTEETQKTTIDGLNIRVNEYDEDLNIISQGVYYVEIVSYNHDTDTALLKVKSNNRDFPVVELATPTMIANLAIGEQVFSAGWPSTPFSNDFQIADGIFNGKKVAPNAAIPLDKDELFYKTTIPAYYGSSGGGLYVIVDDKPYLAGITSMIDPEVKGAFMSYYAPFEAIQSMIEKIPGEPETH